MKKIVTLIVLALTIQSWVFADGMPGRQPDGNRAPAAQQNPQPAPQQPTPEQNFFAAVRRGDVTAARGFLDSGAVNVNAREPNTGMNALMIATDRVDLPMVLALINYRPDPQARDNQNRTVGQIAAGKANPQLSAALANAGY